MWRVEYTKRFLKELASLPKDVQQRAEMIVFQELNSTNPFELEYLEKIPAIQTSTRFAWVIIESELRWTSKHKRLFASGLRTEEI